MATCAASNYGPHKALPKSDVNNQTDRQSNREMYGCICSTGPHWGLLDPSLGINEWCCWTPTPEIDTNTKTKKLPHITRQTDGRMDRWTYGWMYGHKCRRTHYTANQRIWPHSLRPHALRKITGRVNDHQKSMRTTRQRDREIDGQTLRWTDRWTDGHTDGRTDGQTVRRMEGHMS